MTAPIAVLAVPDLFFAARLGASLSGLGYAVRSLPANGDDPLAAAETAALLLIDLRPGGRGALGGDGALETVRALRGRRPDLPILGFVGHVHADRRAEGKAAGCDLVVSNSAVATNLPAVLETLAAVRSGRPAEEDPVGHHPG